MLLKICLFQIIVWNTISLITILHQSRGCPNRLSISCLSVVFLVKDSAMRSAKSSRSGELNPSSTYPSGFFNLEDKIKLSKELKCSASICSGSSRRFLPKHFLKYYCDYLGSDVIVKMNNGWNRIVEVRVWR